MIKAFIGLYNKYPPKINELQYDIIIKPNGKYETTVTLHNDLSKIFDDIKKAVDDEREIDDIMAALSDSKGDQLLNTIAYAFNVNKKALLLIKEPECGLIPSAVYVIGRLLAQLSNTNNNIDIIVFTNSWDLLEGLRHANNFSLQIIRSDGNVYDVDVDSWYIPQISLSATVR